MFSSSFNRSLDEYRLRVGLRIVLAGFLSLIGTFESSCLALDQDSADRKSADSAMSAIATNEYPGLSDPEMVAVSCDQDRKEKVSAEVKGKISGLASVAAGGMGIVRFILLPSALEQEIGVDKAIRADLERYLKAYEERNALKTKLARLEGSFKEISQRAGLSPGATVKLIDDLRAANRLGVVRARTEILVGLRLSDVDNRKILQAFDQIIQGKIEVAVAEGQLSQLGQAVERRIEGKITGLSSRATPVLSANAANLRARVEQERVRLDAKIRTETQAFGKTGLTQIRRKGMGVASAMLAIAGTYLYVSSDLPNKLGVSYDQLRDRLVEEQIACLARNQLILDSTTHRSEF